MSIDLREFPYDLIKSFDKRRGVIAFVGSGPSCHAGLPSWGGLIRQVAHRLGLFDKVEATLKDNNFSWVADFLSKEVEENNLKVKIAEIIREKTALPSLLHEKIVNFDFKGIVTTNYDLLLTNADNRRYFSPPVTNRTASLINLLQRSNDPFIFHLHGNIQDTESIILTLNSYKQLTKQQGIRQALAALFATNDVLFIGFGFVDDHIEEFLTEFRDNSVTNLNVFAVIPDSELDPVKENHLKTLNVKPIRLNESGGDHGVGHLSQWLQTLNDSVKQIEISKQNPVRPKLLNANLADKIYNIILDTDYEEILISTLKNLPNRLDLHHLCEEGLAYTEKRGLLDLLAPNELRKFLISAYSHKPDLVIRDTLCYFPLENN